MQTITTYLHECVSHPRMNRRIPLLLLSVIAMGLCVMVFNSLGVGTDPFSLFSFGMSGKLGLSFGTFEALFNTLVCVIVLFLDRRLIGLGSIANMFLVGYAVDFFTWLIGDLVPKQPELPIQLLWFTPFATLFLLAVGCYIAVDLGTAPYDALPILLQRAVPKIPFRWVRIVFDTFFAVIGVLAGGAFGLMTVVCCVGLGPVIEWTAARVRPFIS